MANSPALVDTPNPFVVERGGRVAEKGGMPAFPHYQLAHRQRLQAIGRSDEWQRLFDQADQADLAELRAAVAGPPAQPAQQSAASTFLVRHNGPRVRKLIDEGVTDEDQLVAALGDWQAAVADGGPMPIVF